MTPTLIRPAALLAAALALLLPAAGASAAETARPLRVAQDKAEVLALSGAASVVLVANPRIADVVLERGRLLFVLGRKPGATRLFVYGENGRPLIERDIVVVPPHERMVTVTRGTRPTDYGCDVRCSTAAAVDLEESAEPAASPANAPQPAAAAPAPAVTPAP